MTHTWWIAVALAASACKGGERTPPAPAATTLELKPQEERTVRLATQADLAASAPGLVVEGSARPVVDAVRAVLDQRKLADTGSLAVRVTTDPPDLAAAGTATVKIEIKGRWLALPHHTALQLTLAGSLVRGAGDDAAAVGRALGERIATAIDQAEPEAFVPKPAGPATDVAVGAGLACSLHADKTVACWGRPESAKALYGPVPTHVPVFDVIELGVAGEHACALHRAGGVSCWGVFGADRSGESSVLANACGTRDATGLAVGGTQICTRSPAGVACWPAERTFDPACKPVPVTGLGKVTALVAGPEQVCALDAGKVRCWSACGAQGCKAGPPVLAGVPSFDVGAEACGVTAKGEVACATKDRPPHAGIAVPAGSQLALEASYGCAVTPEGRPLCWGSNRSGELGDGTTETRLEPVAPKAIPDARSIDPGATEACAVTKAGAVWCWGTPRGTGAVLGPSQLAIY